MLSYQSCHGVWPRDHCFSSSLLQFNALHELSQFKTCWLVTLKEGQNNLFYSQGNLGISHMLTSPSNAVPSARVSNPFDFRLSMLHLSSHAQSLVSLSDCAKE